VKKSKTRTFSPRLEIRKTRADFHFPDSPGDEYLSLIWKTGATKTQTQTFGPTLTYRMQKMVLTMGSTLVLMPTDTAAMVVMNHSDGNESSPGSLVPAAADELLKAVMLVGISNDHTRRAYSRAVDRFLTWYGNMGTVELSRAVVAQY
jgi:hypothetical protein